MSHPSARLTVLIADDDPQDRDCARRVLEKVGYRVLLAEDGAEAIEIVRREEGEIDVVVLGLVMPRLSGLETLQLVRQYNEGLPCILVTADNNEQLMRQAFRARVYSVIPKPVSKNVVLYTVVRAIVRVYGNLQRE